MKCPEWLSRRSCLAVVIALRLYKSSMIQPQTPPRFACFRTRTGPRAAPARDGITLRSDSVELYCVDVGQGTCNVLVLRNRRAVVIDCGPRARELLTLLKRCCVEWIERLIISHNDSDHSGGAAALLDAYRSRIGEIWFVQDSRLLTTPFWEKLDEELEHGYLKTDQLVRLEVDRDNQPRRIFEDSAESLTLKVFAPTHVSVLRSHKKKAPNSSSGIVVMKRDSRCIVFSGDAGAAEWKGVYEARESKLVCDLLSVPHHGGKAGKGDDLAWMYQEAVSPRYAVISVGTANGHHHPRKDVVCSLVSAGASVMCTQITERCCHNLEAFRREGEGKLEAGRSLFQRTASGTGRSQHVACAGTVLVSFRGNRLIIQGLGYHRSRVDLLSSDSALRGHPLCRQAPDAKQSKTSGTNRPSVVVPDGGSA